MGDHITAQVLGVQRIYSIVTNPTTGVTNFVNMVNKRVSNVTPRSQKDEERRMLLYLILYSNCLIPK